MRGVSLIVLLSALALAGCGDSSSEKLVFPEVTVNVPDAKTGETLRGTVFFDGDAPPARYLASPDASCARNGHKIPDETWIVRGGRLANVLIYVKKGAEKWSFPLEKKPADVDQKNCMFRPHVLAVRTWQPVLFKNSDSIIHNVNTVGVEGFPFGTGPGVSRTRQFRKPAIGRRITCDLHANMLMFVHILDHPWFRVTGDDGAFELGPLPPGEYEIGAWHERGGEQVIPLTIREGTPPSPLEIHFHR